MWLAIEVFESSLLHEGTTTRKANSREPGVLTWMCQRDLCWLICAPLSFSVKARSHPFNTTLPYHQLS